MCYLTQRECEVLGALMQMETAIASDKLGITISTIYATKARVRAKVEMARDLLKDVKKYRKAVGVSTKVR